AWRVAFATQRQILNGCTAAISMQSWSNHEMKRKCAHPFGAETLATSEGMAMAELSRAMLFDIGDQTHDLMGPYLLSGRSPVTSAADSRGGCDHVTNPKASLAEDKRAAIDAAIARAAMQRPEVHLRWVEGASPLTDPLAETNGESSLLRRALEQGVYGIAADSIALRRRYEERVKREQKEPAHYACVTDCCYTGLDIYEMSCAGCQRQGNEKDSDNYEP
ncbi:unnamed protein product, partial [Prorocentrum cordatum]